jgi:hypothetical protein
MTPPARRLPQSSSSGWTNSHCASVTSCRRHAARSRAAGLLVSALIVLAPVSAAGATGESRRPLTGRALANLIACTRLLGYVRDFHPSDEAAAADLYQDLDDMVTTYYASPKQWVSIMKNSIADIGPVYNTHRMVLEYLRKYYL